MPLEFKSPKKVSPKIVFQVAQSLSVELPADYFQFLLTYNGGRPTPNVFRVKGDDIVIEHFYSVHKTVPAQDPFVDLERITRHFRDELDLPESLLPIALVNNQDVLVLTVSGKQVGNVSLWWMIESGYERGNVRKVANSFNDLLAMLDKPAASKAASHRQLLEELEDAIMDGKPEVVRQLAPLVDFKKRVPSDWVHPMHRAVLGGNPKVLEALYDSGVDFHLEYDGEKPLKMAKTALREANEQLQICQEYGIKQDAKLAAKKVQSLERTLQFLKDKKIK